MLVDLCICMSIYPCVRPSVYRCINLTFTFILYFKMNFIFCVTSFCLKCHLICYYSVSLTSFLAFFFCLLLLIFVMFLLSQIVKLCISHLHEKHTVGGRRNKYNFEKNTFNIFLKDSV